MDHFELVSQYKPTGDQPQAIEDLVRGFKEGNQCQTLLGVTGSGKTFTMANVIQQINKPTLVIAHNKTLAAQLYGEFKEFFEDGNLSQITTFKNGDMKNIKVFYENGKLKFEQNLKNRKGKYRGYYPNGKLEVEGEVFQGDEIGLWKYYNEDGNLSSEGLYKEGKKIGEWKFYKTDGNLLKTINYKN